MTESGAYFLGTQQAPSRFETALSYPITKLAGNVAQLLFMATDMEGGQSMMAHDALYRDDALYSEETWWSMNPAEFINLNPEYGGYYESYEMMPMDYYQEDFTSYFVIDYGKTFFTEDRATIMEAAMSGNYRSFSKEVSEALYAKLEYYSQCICDCFDTTGWPDVTKWELALK